MNDIEVRFRKIDGEIITVIVKDYGIRGAIETARWQQNYEGLVLSAKYVDEESLIKSLENETTNN